MCLCPPPTGECLRSKLKWVEPIQGHSLISFLHFLLHLLICSHSLFLFQCWALFSFNSPDDQHSCKTISRSKRFAIYSVAKHAKWGKKMTKCKLCDFLHHIISGLTVRMGFSSSLQGDSAHEALITRQDAELRLLENMKRCALHCLGRLWVNIMFRCITLRVKCDREYSIALNSVVLQVRFLCLHC